MNKNELYEKNEEQLIFLKNTYDWFYKKYPKLIEAFSFEEKDSFIERLISAVALNYGLLDQLEQSACHEFPAFLLTQLFPEKIGYYPSTTVVEFQPTDILALNNPAHQPTISISRETPIFTQKDNSLFTFTSCYKGNILPLQISQQKLINHNNKSFLKLSLTNPQKINIPSSFIFYISNLHRDKIFSALKKSLNHIKLFFKKSKKIIIFDKNILSFKGYGKHDLSLNPETRQHPCIHFLYDYFFFPEKFYFFNLTIPKNFHTFLDNDDFEIEFILNESLPNIENQTILSINTFPLINLFRKNIEPFILDHTQSFYSLTADIHDPSVDIFFLEKIDALQKANQNNSLEIYPLFHINGEKIFFNHVTRKTASAKEHWVSFIHTSAFEPEIYYCAPSAKVSQLHAPFEKLKHDENIEYTIQDCPYPLKSTIKSPLRAAKQNHTDQSALVLLKNLMHHHHTFTFTSDKIHSFLENLLNIVLFDDNDICQLFLKAIRNVTCQPSYRVHRKALFSQTYQNGFDIEISLAEKTLVGFDVELFKDVLVHVFKSWSPVNHFVEVSFNN